MQDMRQAITSGEFHLRQALSEAQFAHYVDVGLALREAFRQPAQRQQFIDRLKPHRRLIIGHVPPGIQPHGLLPQQSPTRTLAQIADAELAQWLIEDGALIYGEFTQAELDAYFEALRPYLPARGRFVDLGSGLGKVVMTAALALPGMQCCGIELLGYRHRLAQERLQAMLAAGDAASAAALRARIALTQQDMFEADLRDADMVYIYSTCFASLMERLSDKLARELAPGALVSTATFPLQHPAFELVRRFELAWTPVYLQRRRRDAQGAAAAAPRLRYEPDSQAWENAVRAQFAAYDAGAHH